MAAELLTIDVTVARDYLEPPRTGHRAALELFELARRGEVELATAPQGYGLDTAGDLAEALRAVFETEGVGQAPQLSYPSEVTYPGNDLFPGHFVAGLAEAWAEISANPGPTDPKRPPEDEDRVHVETHIADGRDVFLTSDRSLLATCRRIHDEYGFPIVAMTVSDFLRRREASSL